MILIFGTTIIKFCSENMRLWSIHPRYLDAKGLVALWRESLLAKAVIEGNTKGYTNHPQLIRFKNNNNPIDAINLYLSHIYNESISRGYNFNRSKFERPDHSIKLSVTDGQVSFEIDHLMKKLKNRSPNFLDKILPLNEIDPHPMFDVIPGEIEKWEKY